MPQAHDFLLSFARTQDSTAFRDLVRETAPSLHRFLCRCLGGEDPELIEELCQRTYIAAARRAHSYRGPSATAWLFGIAFRELRAHRRETCRLRAKEISMPEESLKDLETRGAEEGSSPSASVQESERVALLRRALERLEVRERLAVELVHLEGLPYAAVADALQVPVGTVKSRVHRALEALRRHLGPSLAGSCLALLTPGQSEALGPSVPRDWSSRLEAWARDALAIGAAEGSPGATGAPSPTIERAARPRAADGASALGAGMPAAPVAVAAVALAITAGILVIAIVRATRTSGGPEVATASTDGSAGASPAMPSPLRQPRAPTAPEGGAVEEAPRPAEAPAPGHVWARGVVLEASGEPIEGAELRLKEAWDSLEHYPGDPAQHRVWLEGHYAAAPSDREGRFEIALLPVTRDGRMPSDLETVLQSTHQLHLIARAPDGQEQTVRMQTRPAEPAEVEVRILEGGRIRGSLLRGAGVPRLDGAAVLAVRKKSRPERYAYFVRSEVAEDGSFELPSLDPGAWRLEVVHLPPRSSLSASTSLEVQVKPGETCERSLEVTSSRQGLAGTIRSPEGYGVAGSTLLLVDASGDVVERLALGPTPAARRAASGELIRKGAGLGAKMALDVAALPTPFELEGARAGERYELRLETPAGTVERFGPYVAPAGDLELTSTVYEPDAELAIDLEGIDLETARDATLFLSAGEVLLARSWFDSDGSPGSRLEPPVILGLPPGRYSLELYLKAAWNQPRYLHGRAEVDVLEHTKGQASISVQPPVPVEIGTDPALNEARLAAGSGGSFFLNLQARRLAGGTSAFFTVGATRDEAGVLRFALAPGEYLLELPVETPGIQLGTRHASGLVRLDLGREAGGTFSERSGQARLLVTASDPRLDHAMLSLEGTSEEGLPVRVGALRGVEGRWEILSLLPGRYTVVVAGEDGTDAPRRRAELEVRDGQLEVSVELGASDAETREDGVDE